MSNTVSLPEITGIKVVLLVGASGGGKTHAFKYLARQYPEFIGRVIRGSTRDWRPEENGDADLDIRPGLTAEQLKSKYDVVVRENGVEYGVNTDDIEKVNAQGKIAVVVCVRDMAAMLKEKYGDAAFGIFLAPHRLSQEQVLADRSGKANAKERMGAALSYADFMQDPVNKSLFDEVCVNDYSERFTRSLDNRIFTKIAARAQKRGTDLSEELRKLSQGTVESMQDFSMLSTDILMNIVWQATDEEMQKSAVYAFNGADQEARRFVFRIALHESGGVAYSAYKKLLTFPDYLSLSKKLRLMQYARSSTVRGRIAVSLNPKDEKLTPKERLDVRNALFDRVMYDDGKAKVGEMAFDVLCKADLLSQKDYKKMIEYAGCANVRRKALDFLEERTKDVWWILYNRAFVDTDDAVAGKALKILIKKHKVTREQFRDIILNAETSTPRYLAIEHLDPNVPENIDLLTKITARDGENPVVVMAAERRLAGRNQEVKRRGGTLGTIQAIKGDRGIK